MMEVWKRLGLVLALLLAGSAQAVEEGQSAPPFEARLLNGQTFSTAKPGEVVLINFWATWCEPCRKEMPAMEAYYRRHRNQGLRIVAVSMDDPGDVAGVREVMRQYSFDAAMARDASYKGYGRIWRLPLSFVIDRAGILRKDGWFGEAGLDEAGLERDITPLLLKK